jgi:DNA segregation ATPase FtsK/SpoIIIE, S-DNA-T family
MAKKSRNRKKKNYQKFSANRKSNQTSFNNQTKEKLAFFALPEEIKKNIFGIVVFILAVIVSFSFFDMAGIAGQTLKNSLMFLIGKAVFALPLILVLSSLLFFKTKYKNFFGPAVLAVFLLFAGITGMIESFYPDLDLKQGGWLGFLFGSPFISLFGVLVARIIFLATVIAGSLIFWHLIKGPKEKLEFKPGVLPEQEKPSLIKKVFLPNFKVKEIEPRIKEKSAKIEEPVLELKNKQLPVKLMNNQEYKMPPLELLENDKGKATAGDIAVNSTIIKKTLENFGLLVEMGEVNVGPTVTQYTLKPAEGVKLSKITGLSNNISLALASHPIRIEAPIPGKSLVGIEVPNKSRSQIRLRDLVSNPSFQESVVGLNLVLGKNVAGISCYADLAKMPHLLIGGSTGTGKTIFLNSLILSLLYQNSPDTLRLIMVDPKRVEFSVYKDLPHLLTPVIFDPQRTINALKWLVLEMEKRFDVLSANGSRNIASYNQKIIKQGEKPLPYIVLIVDELADLMAAKGREMEAGIIRLAQMARAVGIHLVVATQRPSVEVITGLIKANITSRVTFQVASQVDSRTVLDTAGAEKLLGAGDLLFISAESSRPRRIQGAYVSEKEVKKVVDYINAQKEKIIFDQEKDSSTNHLAEELEKTLEAKEGELSFNGHSSADDDSLYQEAKEIVIEAKKASASLLQRRLRVGYARAARLLDMLEERKVIGPGEGAKPREIYYSEDETDQINQDDDWHKV